MANDRHRVAGDPEILIPGAFELRGDRRPAAPTAAAPPAGRYVPPTVVRRRSMLERAWRFVMRPTDTAPF